MWELNVKNSNESNCAIMYEKEGQFWWKPANCSDSYYALCVAVTNGRVLLVALFIFLIISI